MASSNTDSPGTIYRWIERKPLTEAVSWTSREKFWLITAASHYGSQDWKSVAQVVRNAGEPYRPREWYTPKSCERQYKILVSNLSKEVKSLPFINMLQHIAENLKHDYIRDANKSKETLKSKYCNLFSVLNRVKQGNLSRNEVVSLYSQARRNEIEGKQYMDQLMTRQNASLASENSSSGLIEEQPIKWNTPSAPLLTSLLRSRNTIPANRTATTITSLLQSPGGTSRTRSGKLLSLTPSIRTTQGTPTLSKLLEAPANPYIPSPPQPTQKNKLNDAGTEKLANTSRKENSQSTSLNKARVDNMTTLGSVNQILKSDLSASKRQMTKSPVSAVKNGSKANLSVVNLLSDSETDEDSKNTSLKSSFGDKKDTSSRLEPRATRSQTRAEGGFKQFNDTKLSDGKKERESLRQQSGGSQINETQLIDDELIDIDQIEVEPLSSVQDDIQTQAPSKMTRSSLQRLRLLSPGDSLLTNNKVNSKEISNKMLEEISANFVLNSTARTLAPEYKCLLGQPANPDVTESLIPVDRSACKDAILIRKDSQSLQNTLTTLKQNGVVEIKAANIRCSIDGRNDSKFLSYNNQPIVVVNQIKKPFNIKLTSEQRNKTDDFQVPITDVKKPIRLNNSSQNVVKLTDSSCSFADDEVIIIDDDININEDNSTTIETKELLSKSESKNLPSTVVSSNIIENSKSTLLQLDQKKNRNDKTPWNMFGKTQNIFDTNKKQCHQDSVSKCRTNSNINETNNRFIKELDFDFDQSISQTSLTELYNGVEEIVEMHSFDNEELNSLIECGSLESNETEEHIDAVSADQGDSSVSESDSTIGAFDTFAQITRVRQKSFTSKDIKKLDTKESKSTNQGIKHLKESLCQSDEIDDDQSSPVSVTGIPVLQGIISDVMSQIDLDCVASLKTINPHNVPDVVEISSDEEVTVDVPISHPLTIMQVPTQEKDKEVKSYKLNENEMIKIHEIDPIMYKGVNMKRGTSTNKPINIDITPCIIVNDDISDAERMACDKILEIKKEIAQGFNQDFEMMTFAEEAEHLMNEDEDESHLTEIIQLEEISVKIANDKLLKAERMKKESEERKKIENERKIKEDERKKKEEERKKQDDERKKREDIERKKREDYERMKKEDEEKKKKEEDRKKKEHEKLLQNELYEKKKKEEERKLKEDNERKNKENERKLKELQEKIKMEEELKQLEKKDQEEIKRQIIDKKLKGYHERLRNDIGSDEEEINNEMEMILVVKEEILETSVDDSVDSVADEDYMEEHTLSDDYNDAIVETKPTVESLNCGEELPEIRDLEFQSTDESFERRIKIKKSQNNEDLRNKKEIKILTLRDVQVERGYIGLQRQTIELQSNEAEEAEKQRAAVIEIQRSNEVNVQKTKEVEKQRVNEILSRKFKEAEIIRVKEAGLERIKNDKLKIAMEVEAKKLKEAELRKNIVVKETEIKGLDKRSTLKKVKEPGNNRSVGHTEVNLVKKYEVSSGQLKIKKEHVQNESNIEQVLIENRKAAVKEDFETLNLRERGLRKCLGSEGKISKGIETKSTEIKMITRTRRLKVEEKSKEKNVSKNMSTKLRPQLKSSGSSSSSASSTISSYDYKKPTRNTDDGNKRNSTSNILYDNKNKRDLNVDSNGIVKKETLNREVISIPRTRTRSASFKQKTNSETKSSKPSQDNGTAIIPKETVETKTSVHPVHPTTRSKSPILNFNKTLIIPVVMLTTSEFPLHKVHQRSVDFLKQQEIKTRTQNQIQKQTQNQIQKQTQNQIQKQIATTTQLEKPPPKKRGRKRRIDIQNEKQESNSSNKPPTQNAAKMNKSIKEVEPLAKRTRRSYGLRGYKKESMNDYTQSCSTTDHVQPDETECQPESVEWSSEKCKRLLKYVFNNLCDRSKYISSLNKEIKGIPKECSDVIKFPVELQAIKRKIAAGEITKIGELQANFLILSYNALMINRSDTIVFSDASNFQCDLDGNCLEIKGSANEENASDYKNSDLAKLHDYRCNGVNFPDEDDDVCNKRVTVNKDTIDDLLNNFIDQSDDSTDSEYDSDTPLTKKKRKKNLSYSSNSESD